MHACVCVFVYSLQASWKHTILTPHMAATSTISPTRLCRAVIYGSKTRILSQQWDELRWIIHIWNCQLALICTVYFTLSPVQVQEHQWVGLSCSEWVPRGQFWVVWAALEKPQTHNPSDQNLAPLQHLLHSGEGSASWNSCITILNGMRSIMLIIKQIGKSRDDCNGQRYIQLSLYENNGPVQDECTENKHDFQYQQCYVAYTLAKMYHA